MPVSPESVSSNAPHGAGSARILVVSTSWLGDCVMSMPALSAFRKRLPGSYLAVLAKPSVIELWKLVPGIDEVIPLRKGFSGMRESFGAVRRGGFDFAYILPKSFRSALIPFLARIPGRRGMPGHGRDWMLTERAALSREASHGHQSLEIADVLQIAPAELELPPYLKVPEMARERARSRVESLYKGQVPAGNLVAFFPGAAHGPSKRWPAAKFVEAGRKLVGGQGARVLILGSHGDSDVCGEVALGIGTGAVNLAGATDFQELIALLGLCRCVVANDSGGMHLAAGLGVPVVGLFGLTDPAKTAPVGTLNQLLCAEGVARSRDIERDSAVARSAIASISVDAVLEAISRIMALGTGGPGSPSTVSASRDIPATDAARRSASTSDCRSRI